MTKADVEPTRYLGPRSCAVYTASMYDVVTGRGGWAFTTLIDNTVQEESGVERGLSQQRLELIAARNGLAVTPPASTVTIWTHSYAVWHGMTTHMNASMYAGRDTDGEQTEDRDLWERLYALSAERSVEWRWFLTDSVSGHDVAAYRRAQMLANAVLRPDGAATHPPGGASTLSVRGLHANAVSGDPALASEQGDQRQEHTATAPPLEITLLQAEAGVTDAHAQPNDAEQTLVAERDRQMNTDEIAPAPSSDTRESVSIDHAAAPGGEAPERIDRRNALLAECQALEQRWAELHQQLIELDSEWRRLVTPVAGTDGDQDERRLGWADGALFFFELNQYGSRISGLAGEALKTCNEYAAALQRATMGLNT